MWYPMVKEVFFDNNNGNLVQIKFNFLIKDQQPSIEGFEELFLCGFICNIELI